MYIIKDTQFKHDRYLGGGGNQNSRENADEFKTLKDVCKELIAYHENDNDMTAEKELLKQGNIDQCMLELSYFEWLPIDLENFKQCIHCREWIEKTKLQYKHVVLCNNCINIINPVKKNTEITKKEKDLLLQLLRQARRGKELNHKVFSMIIDLELKLSNI